ncbi:MAG: Prolipoprotein diacylglyceryl transferase [Candidatus Curtissbacteria bacterium GW2011_GWA2_41_24]|uniref:Prolipoprotein diacylglyceryl transferase n=1 Tax=Candidatus Curtissbacteria bacterium GW2011_GWA2_41_24 TaxID=1618411 RepID=A0A0G0YWQ6_9BACT|nr:MAG: Prolipoprotein diacylglyceryl transferase [Candidatus Curtissbacteria bacterium GW2011_GWA2_41_24]
MGVFLYWRAGRHELFESNILFDLLTIAFVGGLIFGRIFDFLLSANIYQWSITRLIFFNIYGSFNWWGALFGAIVSGQIYLKSQKINFWQIFDLASAPIVFGVALCSIGFYVVGLLSKNIFSLSLYKFLGYLVIFWFMKNLARYEAFFIRIGNPQCFSGFWDCFLVSTCQKETLAGFKDVFCPVFTGGFKIKKDFYINYGSR